MTSSKLENEFLDFLKLPNDKLHRQKYINNLSIDGYDSKTKTVYEFLGDYWHGNPQKYNPKHKNINGKTFKYLYNKTFVRFDRIKNRGYNIKYIWENDWNKFKSGINVRPKILTY